MKKIILVRHGKAEDPSAGISDFERSLTLKGKNISRVMGRRIREIEKSPVTIISSPAFRAFETALIFAMEFGVEPENIILQSKLYHKMSIRYLQEMLSAAAENSDTVIIFGHNPSFTEIADSLSGDGCDFMPKSGAASISFNISTWKEMKHKSGKLDFFLKPEKYL